MPQFFVNPQQFLPQELVYYFDDQGYACVDICAKALDIADGDDPNCWKYTLAERRRKFVHYAELLSSTRVDVKGEHSPVLYLTPNTRYQVLFHLKFHEDACGFLRPVTFMFTDQDGNKSDFTLRLNGKGEIKVLVGEFVSVWTIKAFQNVKFRMTSYDSQVKSGLIVQYVAIKAC